MNEDYSYLKLFDTVVYSCFNLPRPTKNVTRPAFLNTLKEDVDRNIRFASSPAFKAWCDVRGWQYGQVKQRLIDYNMEYLQNTK